MILDNALKCNGLKDPFSRQIDYLRISITTRCNLRCVYCVPERGMACHDQTGLLTADELARIAGVARKLGVRKIRITGGEPLMREDIIAIVASIKLAGIRDLSITTNGIFLAEKAAALKKAGLDRVNISLDTMDAARYRHITRGGDIRRVLMAIDAAETAGLVPLKLNIVPIRGVNDDEIAAFAALTMERDFHVRFIEFMPTKHNGWRREACIGKDELMVRLATLGRLAPLEFRGQSPSRNYRIEGAKGVVGFISPVSDHFCGTCNRLRLTASGGIRPCLFSDIYIDIKTPLRAGAGDEELAALLRRAVADKPMRHSINSAAPSTAPTAMSEIGG